MEDASIILERKPELICPSLFAAWPGMGNVSFNAARYIVDQLQMEPLGSIESPEYSMAEGINIHENQILPLQIPEYRFYLYQHPEEIGDLIVFLGDSQPSQPQGFSLAQRVIQVGRSFGVRRLFTCAALATSITHMESPRVWGVATHGSLLRELEALDVMLLTEGNVSGLNGLLLGIGKQMGFEGVGLLGELPYYTVGTENPKSSLAVLEKFCRMWDIPVDLTGLRDASLRKEMEIEEFIRKGDKESILESILKKDGAGPEVPQ
jgi:proteasome assembly chaperone (PAC2) family protein